MDAAEYKHVVLGLIFLKYISDTFDEIHRELENDREHLSDPEDRDEYIARNVFWVPPEARWEYLQRNAKQPTIGKMIDDAMDVIERDNPSLKGVLPTNYSRPSLDKQRLGELIDLIGSIALGTDEAKSRDLLGRVYEYFLGQFADAEGKKGGQFYTPKSIVQLLVEIIEPYRGRVYDPCCGSGGMFVQNEKFIQAHQGRLDDIHIFGEESNQTTWKLCKMNLAIRNIDSDEVKWGDSFLNDLHKDLRADFILANPPFNDSDWKGELLREDVRWKFGVPPTGNANFAWVQHFIHHLSPTGIAGFVLSNGSLSSNTSNEGEIRKNIIEADLMDCIVALPPQLFFNTGIPACLWFVSRDKKNNKFRDRRGKTLLIDARKMGTMIDRRHRVLTDDDIKKISSTYHAWRGEVGKYADVLGFCKSSDIEDIRKNNYVLTPGRYVGTEEQEEDDDEFEEKMQKLTSELKQQMEESARLDEEIKKNLERIGFEF
ncbi:MAG: SAM-dependent DNA methyltransferase [Nitrososphaerota archaeon]|nr:SAM-dependent DNA methyltransferase [Nitrososphaerota archaeon]